MTEQVNNEQVGEEEVSTPNEVEQRALSMGWRPREEFDGDDVDFIDAKEFVGRKPLYDKIGQQSKELKAVREAVEALKGHYTKVREVAVKDAIKALKDEKKQALNELDADKVIQLDDEIKEAEREFDAIKQDAATPAVRADQPVHPDFANWVSKNAWYQSVGYMRAFADQLGSKLANTMSPGEVLREVEKEVRKEFPNKFVNANKADAPDVGSSKGTGKTKGDSFTLDEREKRVMEAIVRTGALTKEQYIADLKKVKGVK